MAVWRIAQNDAGDAWAECKKARANISTTNRIELMRKPIFPGEYLEILESKARRVGWKICEEEKVVQSLRQRQMGTSKS